jgi:hypothetical protein
VALVPRYATEIFASFVLRAMTTVSVCSRDGPRRRGDLDQLQVRDGLVDRDATCAATAARRCRLRRGELLAALADFLGLRAADDAAVSSPAAANAKTKISQSFSLRAPFETNNTGLLLIGPNSPLHQSHVREQRQPQHWQPKVRCTGCADTDGEGLNIAGSAAQTDAGGGSTANRFHTAHDSRRAGRARAALRCCRDEAQRADEANRASPNFLSVFRGFLRLRRARCAFVETNAQRAEEIESADVRRERRSVWFIPQNSPKFPIRERARRPVQQTATPCNNIRARPFPVSRKSRPDEN